MKNIKNNKTILAVIPAVVVLAAGVAFFCSRSGNTDKQCQETVERLQKLETADISSIEDAIRALSEKEKPTGSDSEEGVLGDILTDVQIKQAFQGTVIVGDSITESIAEYGFLDTSIVVAKLGLRIDDADDQINTAISLNPSVFFLSFGANDLEIYNGDSSAFIDAYRVKVKQIQNALPDTAIYINSILPIQQSAIDQSPALAYYDSFNQALRDFCDEMGCTFIDDTFLVDESMYEPDGEHMVYNYPNGLLIWQKGQVSYEAEYQTKYPLRFFRQTERQSEEK